MDVVLSTPGRRARGVSSGSTQEHPPASAGVSLVCQATKQIGGSEWESNPPRTTESPYTGFEDRESHRTPCASVSSESRAASSESRVQIQIAAKQGNSRLDALLRRSGRFGHLLVFGLRRYPEVRFQLLKPWELLLRLVIAHRSWDDDVLSRSPIDRCSNVVPGADL